MDPFARILVQAAQWFRRPPSPTHLRILVAVILGALALVAVERFVGWPDWARVEHGARLPGRP